MRKFHDLLLSNYVLNKKNSMEQSPSEADNSLTGLQKSPSRYHREDEILDTAKEALLFSKTFITLAIRHGSNIREVFKSVTLIRRARNETLP